MEPKQSLPNGWIVRQSTTYPDRIYYFNTKTGSTAWTLERVDALQRKTRKGNSVYDSSRSEGSTVNESQARSLNDSRRLSSVSTVETRSVQIIKKKKCDLAPKEDSHADTNHNKNIKEYIEHFEKAVKDPLSVVLETELNEQFGALWRDVVAHKPPWNMSEIFTCINDHWYTAFHFLPRRCQEIVKDWRDLFLNNGKPPQLQELRKLVGDCVDFLTEINEKMAYGDLLTAPIGSLNELCADLLKTEAAFVQLNVEKDEMLSEKAEKATKMFASIWHHMQASTARLCDVFQVTHNICNPTAVTTPKDVAEDCLRRLLKTVNLICEHISRVACSSREHRSNIKSLFTCLIFYFNDLDQDYDEFHVTESEFQNFCDSNRDYIKSRYYEVDGYRKKLEDCLPQKV